MDKCIFCNNDLIDIKSIGGSTIYSCKCPNCGEYEISSDAFIDLKVEFSDKLSGTQYLVSGYIFETNMDCQQKVQILTTTISDILKRAKERATVQYKLDRLLSFIYSETAFFGMNVNIDKNHTAICYALSREEVHNLCKALDEMVF